MPGTGLYWLENRQVPYATFLTIIHGYLNPEVDDIEGLQDDANRTDMPDMITFKKEFREAIANPGVLPEGALPTASEYEDGTDEAFLARLGTNCTATNLRPLPTVATPNARNRPLLALKSSSTVRDVPDDPLGYLHPDASDMDSLQVVANREDMPDMVSFKREFHAVIADLKVLPDGALLTASGYEDGTDNAFLRRLWRDLYGDETPTAIPHPAS